MDKITEFLRDNNSRISYSDRWLCVTGVGDDVVFFVYQRKYNAKKTITIYQGESLDTALRILEGGE